MRRTIAIYIALLVALLVQPHALQGHVRFLPSAWAQTVSTLVILGLAAATYAIHRRALTRAERRNATLMEEKRSANEKLLDSFRYIGTVNRRLPLLQEVTTGVLRDTPPTSKGMREALERLLALAVVTTARAPWGHLRFVDRSTRRTMSELRFAHSEANTPHAPIGNADLLALESSTDEAQRPVDLVVIWSADRWAPHQTFLILGPHTAEGHDRETLQSLLDQAHLYFAHFSARQPGPAQQGAR